MTKSLSACSSSVAVVNAKIIASSYKPCSFCTGLTEYAASCWREQPAPVLRFISEILLVSGQVCLINLSLVYGASVVFEAHP